MIKDYHRIVSSNLDEYDCPYLHKYLNINNQCVICEYANIQKSCKLNEDTKDVSIQKKLSLINYRNLIRFKIFCRLNFQEKIIINESIENVDQNILIDFTNFINAINFNKPDHVVQIFDSIIFSRVLLCSHQSKVIDKFINMFLIVNFNNFPRFAKIECFYILIFCYLHRLSTGYLNIKDVAKKIEQNKYLFVPTSKFSISILGDHYIQNYTLKMIKATNLFSKATHLARINIHPNRDHVFFKNKFIEYIHEIPADMFYSFVKIVFTYRIVTFSNVSDVDLYEMIFSIFKKHYKKETVFSLLEIFYEKTLRENLLALLVREILNLDISTQKYGEKIEKIKIQHFTSLAMYKNYIIDNYNNINLMIIEFKELYELFYRLLDCPDVFFEKYKNFEEDRNQFIEKFSIEFLSLLIFFYEMINKELFPINYLVDYTGLLNTCLNSINTVDNGLHKINIENWSFFSTFLLYIEKLLLEKENFNQGIKNMNSLSKLSRLVWKSIVSLEAKLEKSKYSPVNKIKQKAFKILNE